MEEIKSLYPDVDVYARKFDAADEGAVMAVIYEATAKYDRLDGASMVGYITPNWVSTESSILSSVLRKCRDHGLPGEDRAYSRGGY